MKYIIITLAITNCILFAGLIYSQILLQKSWDREKEWSQNVNKSLAVAESFEDSYKKMKTAYEKMASLAERKCL